MRSTYPSGGRRDPSPAANERWRPCRGAALGALRRGTTAALRRPVRTQPVATDLTGSLVGGYRLERRLGGSAAAQVYFGRHERLGRAAAVKLLSPHLALDEEAMSRFFCEARAVAELGSEHLVEVYDFVFEPRKERVAYIMEYLAGD